MKLTAGISYNHNEQINSNTAKKPGQFFPGLEKYENEIKNDGAEEDTCNQEEIKQFGIHTRNQVKGNHSTN
jgi:hypothetical protein